ncbi:4Fe-4S dicluster domain-containing protein [Chlorobium phaeobacteroides]|jgi:ferredoxin|uniref:4Fe-4S ferredoxin, iron-sulfur binding domain protein n=1 Tax=Chlorobium phaeobacteroides (strain DSM 266 / SMG 266 / 2430) TaxID=290317 RepID=A1BFW3_CHLPD|nr:4Fe-4S dicluster domain-containing protein [Chlorobium phaeobacteroides]ABL65290.1 4Fe-4S ferredoxin, iron-sulfur binding domain protein [Chlorobium phaeobacteroides DSM 266]MBV5327876.1 4Fe-4S dicluster domain-containing protein [Chlorobium sp.]
MTKILLAEKLNECISRWRTAGIDVIGPVKKHNSSQFESVQSAAELDLGLVLTDRTIKDLFFPRTEPMVRYQIKKHAIETEEFLPPDQKRIIFGVRPCDASGLAIDDPLFGWDYKDEYWFNRRNESVMITIACTKSDEFCMCTSLKLAPDSSKGSDILLRPLADEKGWLIEELSDRGKEAFSSIADLLIDDSAPLAPLAEVPVKFNLEASVAWLKNPENFDSHFWKEISARCIGCGSCTFLCPTCHCFDIQDEGDIYKGIRRKNWDSCSFALFTMHTSGHNPRVTQSSRWRQRIMHKFNYFPGKFDMNSCSGCGRCTRQCPVDMGITETLQEISKLSR